MDSGKTWGSLWSVGNVLLNVSKQDITHLNHLVKSISIYRICSKLSCRGTKSILNCCKGRSVRVHDNFETNHRNIFRSKRLFLWQRTRWLCQEYWWLYLTTQTCKIDFKVAVLGLFILLNGSRFLWKCSC